MPTKAETPRITLGLGEEAEIRQPTKAEQSTYGIGATDLVVEYRHADRAPEVLPARGITIEPRRYGVKLPDRLAEES